MHVWAALKHRNICEFLGYSTDFSDYPAMVSMVSLKPSLCLLLIGFETVVSLWYGVGVPRKPGTNFGGKNPAGKSHAKRPRYGISSVPDTRRE